MSPMQIVARLAVWILAIATIITGITFISNVTAVKWTPEGDGNAYDVVGLGTGLLCVGLLVLAALLIIEAYRPRVSGSASTPDA